ncbi:unnamed protein product [Miscanthus lutarioriparius]|uniref:beta-ketoacyl-[acyl-carrier-protein] synthase I n=1 Tax=Miscanthus lutarioriparius TaxID=422564 RepID=A0A811PF23_9POAL|nr:unnamed protein product [Miscanthus lutarioriparius]
MAGSGGRSRKCSFPSSPPDLHPSLSLPRLTAASARQRHPHGCTEARKTPTDYIKPKRPEQLKLEKNQAKGKQLHQTPKNTLCSVCFSWNLLEGNWYLFTPEMPEVVLGWMGPNYSISTACATINFCILNAANHIRRGEADLMLCGGSDAPIIPIGLGGFVACRALSQRNSDPAKASRPRDVLLDYGMRDESELHQ